MTVEEAKKEIIRVIRDSTETELELTEETNLFSDMGDLEDTFGVDIPASRLRNVRTVGDICELVITLLTK